MPQPRPSLPSHRGLRCEAVAIVDDQQAPAQGADGRWQLYSGGVMQQWLTVPGIGAQVVDVVVDLATCRAAKERIPCLRDHEEWGAPVGNWSSITIDDAITATLSLYRVDPEASEMVQWSMSEAERIRALLEQDHPWEASIGEDTRNDSTYEVVPPGTTLDINGRTIEVGDERPFLVARDVVICEASIVLFGADGSTGRIAAALVAQRDKRLPPTTQKDATMDIKERKAALLAKHPESRQGLICAMLIDGKDDAAIEAKIVAEDMKDKDDELEALKAEIETLKSSNAELQAKLEAMDDEETTDDDDEENVEAGKVAASGVKAGRRAAAGSSDESDAPKNLRAALVALEDEMPKATRAQRISAAYRRWPKLDGRGK